ncbi:ras-related protein Rab-2A-like isoform X2 [Drosophila hydei]|nr:ras-related protein Rab-2A-like isoform X2 [Drosophila hydei]
MDWVVELREKTSTGMVIVLAGNKADMEANRVITKNEAEEFAALHNLIFMETSCVSGMNVHNCFVELANVIQSEVDEKDSRTKKVKGSSHGKWSCWCITGSSPELNKTK